MRSKLATLFALGLVVFGWCFTERGSHAKPSPKTNTKAPEIAGYKKWQVVNEKAHSIGGVIAVMCAPNRGRGSHPSKKGKYIRVFVNEKGKAAMFSEIPKFPPGSVIVKEKLPLASSIAPELLTVMIKRQPGYDASKGDWEYLVTSGSGQKSYQRGKLANCQSCHVEQFDSDYIFREYLSESERQKAFDSMTENSTISSEPQAK